MHWFDTSLTLIRYANKKLCIVNTHTNRHIYYFLCGIRSVQKIISAHKWQNKKRIFKKKFIEGSHWELTFLQDSFIQRFMNIKVTPSRLTYTKIDDGRKKHWGEKSCMMPPFNISKSWWRCGKKGLNIEILIWQDDYFRTEITITELKLKEWKAIHEFHWRTNYHHSITCTRFFLKYGFHSIYPVP